MSRATFDATLLDELEDEESAKNYLENHSTDATATGRVTKADTRVWKESAPSPFITSTLQQQASALFRAGPKQTMQAAQRLYEEGHITYMRTDNPTMSDEAVVEAKKQVEALYGPQYVYNETTVVGKKKKGPATASSAQALKAPTQGTVKAQEAHEAIRPTHFDLLALGTDRDWNWLDKKLYTLIWTRAMQSCMTPTEGEKRTVQFVVEGDSSSGSSSSDNDASGFKWEATWKRTTFDGWHKAGTTTLAIDDTDVATEVTHAWDTGAALQVGTMIKWQTLRAAPHVTKAPGRYNEATLVRELEKRGIGRPSTFAMLTETIQEKKYVEKKTLEGHTTLQKSYRLSNIGQWPPTEEETAVLRGVEKDKLIPSGLGCSVVRFALTHFGDLFDYAFTSTMESRLDKIATGAEAWKDVLHATWNSYKERYFALKTMAAATIQEDRRRELGDGLVAIQTRNGPLLMREGATKEDTKFYGWPPGVVFGDVQAADAVAFIADLEKRFGDYEGDPIVLKEGKYGKFCAWRSHNIPYKEGDTVGDILQKLEAKIAAVASGTSIGPFDIRKGPYGLYMFKRDAVNKQFVSVPAGINIHTLTPAAATVLFQKGLETKAKGKAFGTQRFNKKGGGRDAKDVESL